MNRLFYDPLGCPSGAGGGEIPNIPEKDLLRIRADAEKDAEYALKYENDRRDGYIQGAQHEYRRRLSPQLAIPRDIVSFWDEVLKKPITCPDESRYFEWCFWMLKNEHPVHQIQLENEVDKVVYTVGDKRENGEIKSLHWRGNYWSYRNEKGDGISINGPIEGDDYHRDRFQRKVDESSSLHNKKSNNNE